MKLRIRIRGRTEKVDVGDAQLGKITLGELRSAVAQLAGLEPESESFELSLNGRDRISGNPDEPLDQFGIVSGDLVKVLLPEGPGQNTAPGTASNRASSSQRTRPDTHLNGSISLAHETTATRAGCSSPENSRSGSRESAKTSDNGAECSHENDASPVSSEMSREEKEAREQLEQLERETAGDVISEPMLCRDAEDGKIPLLLRQLCLENPSTGPGDALCLALHVLMIETGFDTKKDSNLSDEGAPSSSSPLAAATAAPSNTESQTEGTSSSSSSAAAVAAAATAATAAAAPPPSTTVSQGEGIASTSSPEGKREEEEDWDGGRSTCLPPGWKSGTSYRLPYQHPECRDLTCALAVTSLGTTLIVHGLVGKEIKASTQLKPASFASVGEEDQVSFKNLALLSRTFKDAIAYPLLADMRQELGLLPLNGLLALVPEIQLKILSFLPLPDVLTMSTLCHHFNSLAIDALLWRQLLLRDFGGKATDKHCNWKSVYREKYRLRKMRDQLRSRIQRNFYPLGRRPFAFVPPVPTPLYGIYPPGYRGGDYDIDPFRAGAALPGYPRPGFQPVPGAVVPRPMMPGPRHDPIFPDPDINPRPGHGGGLMDMDVGRPHPYVPSQPQGFPMMPGRRTGGRGGNLRGSFR